MQISLPPELEKFVEEEVRAGEYATPDDVVEDALQLLRHLPAWTEEELRREIAVGIKQLDRGEGTPWDVEKLLAKVHREHAARK